MKRKIVFALLASCLILLGGCGNDGKNANIENGYKAIMSQNYSEALGYFDEALLKDEDIELSYRGRGLAFMGAGEYERALSAFQTALSNADMFPGDLEYDINYYMAVCHYKLGNYNEAIDVYDAIVNLRPKDSDAYYLRGKMKLYVKDIEGAVEDFDQAISLDKKNYGLYIDIYEVMTNLGYANEANQYLDVVMAADVDDIEAIDKGRLCYYQGDYSRGCAYLETARQQGEQGNPELISLLGECYKKVGNYEFAAVIYSSYLENIEDPVIYNQLGLCYAQQGNYEAALNAFSKGIDVKENNTCMQTLKLNEIVCYEYMHDYATAKEKLSEYMTAYPADPILDKEFAFLTTR